MKELELKYGCNPNQKPSRIYMEDGELPIEVLSGKPGYINFLDAFNGWQLVSELKKATGLAAATSFKHVSPAGAAVGLPLSDVERKIYWCDDLDMECGKLRFRTKGSAGGHNGLKNIILHTGTEVFNRIKIGISRDKLIPVVDWVLGHFSKDDQIKMDQAFERASESLKDYLTLHKDIQHLALDLTK